MTCPSVADLKAQAKRLRKALGDNGQALSHSQALELVSTQHGFRDWNTASAAASRSNRFPLAVGDRVSGTYMRQAINGEILALSKLGTADRFQVTIQFDEAVDVVSFDSFSAFRSRVNCLIRADGVSVKHTSDGEPYLRLNPSD